MVKALIYKDVEVEINAQVAGDKVEIELQNTVYTLDDMDAFFLGQELTRLSHFAGCNCKSAREARAHDRDA
jgi:hypothetical protein